MANPASEHAVLRATHWARVISYWLTLLLALASEWGRARAPGFWIATVLITVGWPHVVYAIARRARDPRAADVRHVLIDSALGGLLAAALRFAVLPTVALLVPTLATMFRAGGPRLLGASFGAGVVGAIVGGLIYGFVFRLDTGPAGEVVSLVLLVTFIFYFAAVARWQGGAIRQGRRALEVALDHQRATSEVMRVITTARADLDVVFSTIVSSAVRLCHGMMGGVFRYDGELLHLVAHHNYSPEALAAVRRTFPLRPTPASIAARAVLERAVINVPDTDDEPGYGMQQLATTIGFRSMLAAPMLRHGEPIGVIAIGRGDVGEFSVTDVELLKMFCDQAAIAIENLRLRHELEDKQALLERELASAREIQLSMVPTDFPAPGPGTPVELHAALLPARQVGGDLYDFFWRDPDALYVVVADVSDKGAPAALFMARAKTLVRLIATLLPGAGNRAVLPHEIIARVNHELCQDNPFGMFVTLFVGLFSPASGELSFCNAGHTLPYLVRPTGEVTPVSGVRARPVGISGSAPYASSTVRLAVGDCLFVFTDGIPDAVDETGAFYEDARLEATLRSLAGESPRAVVAGVLDSVRRFAGQAPPADDIAMVALRRVGAPSAVVELTITNRPGDLERVAHAVDELGAIHGVPSDVVADVNVALDEILTNVVTHGYPDEAAHEIRVRVAIAREGVDVDVEDDGIAFDPTAAAVVPPAAASVRDRAVGGLGLHLVRNLMDEVSYVRAGTHNRVHLRKRLRLPA
jgi:sigma-B regulation protein RsbU (phosphoserine phosphatase)